MNLLLYATALVYLQAMDGAPPVIEPVCNPPYIEYFNPESYATPRSTNTLFPHLIMDCDSSSLTRLILQTPFVYTASYRNGDVVKIQITNTSDEEQAYDVAYDYANTLGQLPSTLRIGFRMIRIGVGNGNPYSEQDMVQTYTDLGINRMGFTEENLMHDLAHISLNSRGGLINEARWKEAMAKDNFYPSVYAEHHHSGNGDPYIEDVPETIVIYLAVRWRPERFDTSMIDFYNLKMQHRFNLLDELNWQQ